MRIAPTKGKLGVLLVGLGTVSTTFVAGVLAVKKGIGEPIGSLTQMGTIRLGKRTDNKICIMRLSLFDYTTFLCDRLKKLYTYFKGFLLIRTAI